MNERDAPERRSIIVATPHPLDMRLSDGDMYRFEAPDRNPDNQLDYTRIIRAVESQSQVARLTVEFAGVNREIDVFELDHPGEIENPQAIRRLLGGLGAAQCIATSRMGGRFLLSLGLPVEGKYCHPAVIVRDKETGAPIAAEQFAIPQSTEYNGDPDIANINRARALNDRPYHLISYFPQDMYFLDKNGLATPVPRIKGVIDVVYDYESTGQTVEGVRITKSRPKRLLGAHAIQDATRNTLVMVHWEALIEGLRTGALSINDAAKMVFPLEIGRLPSGQQGPCFTKLGYYSPTTLRRILYDVKT